jgi:hypothetical protein
MRDAWKTAWFPGIAIALAACLALPFASSNPPLRNLLMALASLGLVAACASAVLIVLGKSRYDLSALAEVHERAELDLFVWGY